jgi:hypothetical protein
MARIGRLALLAFAVGGLATPAVAQFNPFEIIFGPPRPPQDVPQPGNRQNLPPPPHPPVQTRQPPPQARPPAQVNRAPAGGGGVQSNPLPPPPGGAAAPPGQRRGPQQPADTSPKPGDEVVTAPPSQKIINPTAVFSGLDKVTGRIISFDVALNETVQFGALQVTPRVCYTRPPTETPNTDAFIEVEEVTLQGEVKRIFTGWMFAASPGLHGVEHSIYDVWLVDCKKEPPTVTAGTQQPPPKR